MAFPLELEVVLPADRLEVRLVEPTIGRLNDRHNVVHFLGRAEKPLRFTTLAQRMHGQECAAQLFPFVIVSTIFA